MLHYKGDSIKVRQFQGFLFFYGILMLIPPAYIYAQTLDQGNLITVISISGLKRTKLSVVEGHLKQFLGQEGDTLKVDEVYAAIKDTGILEPLSVEIENDPNGEGKILKVEVREKWAVFLLPVISVSSGAMNFGGFFIDTNALGLNDKFFLGGMYSPTGWMSSGGYIHTYGGSWLPGWRVSLSFSRQERHNTDQQNQDLRRFNLDALNSSGGITYPFMDIFNGSLNLSYREVILRDHDNPLQKPESDARMIGIGTEIMTRKTYWDGFLLSEQSASLRYTFMAGIEGASFQAIRFRGIYEKSLIPGFRLNLHVGMVYDPEVPVLFESSPAAAQVHILPTSFFAQHYTGASLGIEKYLFKFSFGTLSVLASYQVVYSHGSILGSSFDHGFAGFISFYLSKLAIPALGLGIAYNVPADYVQASFSLGMSF